MRPPQGKDAKLRNNWPANYGPQRVFTSGGSGGDADTLNGQAGAYYLALENSTGHFNRGINWGSAVAASADDLSRHIALYGTGYGFSVTGSQLNYNTNAGANHVFYVGGVEVGRIGATKLFPGITDCDRVFARGLTSAAALVVGFNNGGLLSRYIAFYGNGDGVRTGYLQGASSGAMILNTDGGASLATTTTPGNATVNGNLIWHSGNDGAGSALDAGLLAGRVPTVSGNRYDVVPYVASDGTMDIGRYLDFHNSDGDTSNLALRLHTNGGTQSFWFRTSAGAETPVSGVSQQVSSGDTNFPLGYTVAATADGGLGIPNRRNTLPVRLETGNSFEYTMQGAGTVLSGTYLACGITNDAPAIMLMERSA